MIAQSDAEHYRSLCQRVDEFIQTVLLQGTFNPSRVETERIYLALGAMFPDEQDIISAFWDRLSAHHLMTVTDAVTGEDLFVNLRLAPWLGILIR